MQIKSNNQLSKYSKYIDINILSYGEVDGDDEWNFRNVNSPFHRLYYINHGYVNVIGDVNHKICSNQICFTKANTTMDYYADAHFRKQYIHFQCPLLNTFDLLDNADDFILLDKPTALNNHMSRLSEQDTIGNYIKCISIIYQFISLLMTEFDFKYYNLTNIGNTYHKLIEFINNNLNASISVKYMAEFCGQSVSDFSRKFKTSTGISPKAYLHYSIIKAAKNQLLSTGMSITQIANSFGYDDSLYFSRFFKKTTGTSPSDYRKNQII